MIKVGDRLINQKENWSAKVEAVRKYHIVARVQGKNVDIKLVNIKQNEALKCCEVIT
tara:strand:- start:10698 stop:10868 length:171 start_codon:yes stop_codon:yes gene_type:complete